MSVGQLVPPEDTLTRYFRYQGSLTTPRCDESVVWTLFETPVLLSRQQVLTWKRLVCEIVSW